jgi:superfamily II DNA or RNA helicase
MNTSHDDYAAFLSKKAVVAPTCGITVPRSELHPHLFPFQRDIVDVSLRRGRAAIFADTGLGKGWMALEWLRHVAAHTDAPVLLLAPLAVSQQFVREGEKFGVPVTLCASDDDVRPGINVTNYHKLHKFDVSQFGGVALDESSILKAMDGATRNMLIDAFRDTPFRLSLTATPSPNDHTELGNQAEFLGVMTRTEMLSMFFVHDGETTQEWRLKGHAEEPFWKWVSSWAVALGKPSDLGYADEGYDLPPLREHVHSVRAPIVNGMLFAEMTQGLADQRAARKATIDNRVAECARLAGAADGQVIVWCDLNAEGDALEDAIPGAIQVKGSQDEDEKEALIEKWIRGDARVMVSKSSIMGFGLNLQFAHNVIFCGITHSWESYYQAIRRCWRFGQDKPVDVHVVASDADAGVISNLRRKQDDANTMRRQMVAIMAEHTMRFMNSVVRTTDPYNPTERVTFPSWLVTEAKEIAA